MESSRPWRQATALPSPSGFLPYGFLSWEHFLIETLAPKQTLISMAACGEPDPKMEVIPIPASSLFSREASLLAQATLKSPS